MTGNRMFQSSERSTRYARFMEFVIAGRCVKQHDDQLTINA
jgi:hypothetical protein